jgi:glycosyltransferase involved in cell wall biosynthesis
LNYLIATEEFFPEQPGGAGRIAWELGKLMRARGHDVTLLAGTHAERPPPVGLHEGITVARYAFPRLRSWDPRRLGAHVAAARDATRALGGRWDVVHAHTLAPGLGAFQAVGRAARRISTIHSPAVLEQRITWSHAGAVGRVKLAVGEPMLRRAERALLTSADRLTALSRFTIRETAAMYGRDLAERITCVPWWSDADPPADRAAARHALGWPAKGTIFYTLRRLVPRMGIDVLIGAARSLPRNAPWTVYVAGDGPERARLEALAADAGLGQRARFLGRIDDATAHRAYEACDAFALPTRALECFGIIALEALSRGRPVIGSRVGAIPEMLEPVLPDWIFSPGDERDLARVMRGVLDGTLAAPDATELRRYAQTRYGRDAVREVWARWIEGSATCAS